MRERRMLTDQEMGAVWPDGSIRWLSVNAVPLTDRAGAVRGAVVTFIEITEQKRMREQLEEYSRHLEKLVEEKTVKLREAERLAAVGETALMVGHDLRNPMQVITNSVYLAQETLESLPKRPRTSPDDLDRFFETVLEQIKYMNKRVSDLQDYGGPLQPGLVKVDLLQLARDAVLAVRIPEKVSVSVEGRNMRPVRADATLLKRVLINLITNAVQAMPEGGAPVASPAGVGECRKAGDQRHWCGHT